MPELRAEGSAQMGRNPQRPADGPENRLHHRVRDVDDKSFAMAYAGVAGSCWWRCRFRHAGRC